MKKADIDEEICNPEHNTKYYLIKEVNIMSLYTSKTLEKCYEIRNILIDKGYKCQEWFMEGGFCSVRYCSFERPNGSCFYTETLNGLKKELQNAIGGK